MTTNQFWDKTSFWHQNIPLMLLLVFNLAVGAVFIKDYGLSWDEPSRYRVAEKSLATYLGRAKEPTGRLYLAFSELGATLVNNIFSHWTSVESWHFFNFIYFQISLVFLFMICRRNFDPWVSLATTLLYASQPLLWGHAFINPKDIPFTMYFLGSLAFGLKICNIIPAHQIGRISLSYPQTKLSIYQMKMGDEWSKVAKPPKRNIRRAAIFFLIVLLILIIMIPLIGWAVKYFVMEAIQSNSQGVFFQKLTQFAEHIHEIPPELYAQKAVRLYLRFVAGYCLFMLLLFIGIFAALFPQTIHLFGSKEIIPLINDAMRYLKSPSVWAAGFCIGMAASVRVLGPASWVLLAGYLVLKFKRIALPPALASLAVAVLILIIAWPSMWFSPLEVFQTSAIKASDFPWESTVMFAGREYPANQLPRAYFPVLFSLQITEPALMLFIGGIGVVILGLKNHSIEWQFSLLLAGWFFIPFIGVIIFQPTMYDNFRHFLFILPPIFIFGGICLQAVFRAVSNRLVNIIIFILCMVPSIIGIIQLHPYQYIYYNSFTGGVSGAFRKYELDYWATSYREAAQFINQNAPRNAKVMVWGPARLGIYYCRPDLEIQRSIEGWNVSGGDPIYAIISTRHNKDLSVFPNAAELFSVERNGARLVVVKQLSP
ncbi:MAG: hypothetical protein GYA34_14425 [Chloroflexi bacterium]|nr:hypothetical protein [Chloroflexota bacterium]